MRRPGPSGLTALLTAGLLLAGATGLTGCSDSSAPSAGGTSSATASPPAPPAYDLAVSTPAVDSVYPSLGSSLVDALHYDLELTWTAGRLSGTETLTFRATAEADRLVLDLSSRLRVSAATLDGDPVATTQALDDLTVTAPVRAEARHVLVLEYAGTPAPVPDPSQRGDSEPLGLTATPEGGAFTFQEPYGAFTWYAVNDQPADKALYDVTVHTTTGLVGISNGTLTERTDTAAGTTTVWHSSAPMASYLTTLAIGDYVATEATSTSGIPLTYWTSRADPTPLATLKGTPALLSWLEARLGPYPFDSLSMVIVPTEGAMETQTTLTLGNLPTDYSEEVLVHEIAHQWYGDLVTPADWRDVWMNEGMATYLQMEWQDAAWDRDRGDSLSDLALYEAESRRKDGPPGAYKPSHFAADNVYSGPALMWDKVRARVGEETFWRLVAQWPATQRGRSVTREAYVDWLSATAGTDLSGLLRSWLMSPTTPRG